MPRWSVIMPVKNGQSYVCRAVTSTLRALPQDAELRVMDDGSSDRTPNILTEIARDDRRLVVERHESGAGVAASLNELIGASDSLYVGRMDGDDVCLPVRWRLGEHLLRTHDLAFSAPIFIDPSGKPRGTDQPGRFSPEALPFHLLLGSMLVHPTAMMRRDVLESLGGYRLVAAEDYDLWLRAAARGHRLVRSAVPSVLYRRHPEQVTNTSPWNTHAERSRIWGPYCDVGALVGIDLPLEHDETIDAMLGDGSHSPAEAARREEIILHIVDRARHSLGPVDLINVQFRATRERRRIRAERAPA